LRGHSPNFHIHVSVSDLYNLKIDLGIPKSLTDTNVEIGTEATQFPEKEYINDILVAVYSEFLKRFWFCLERTGAQVSRKRTRPRTSHVLVLGTTTLVDISF
jgi:hypothetical protein